MKYLLRFVFALLALGFAASCQHSLPPAEKQRAADSLSRNGSDRPRRAGSLSSVQADSARIQAKKAFLQDFYTHVMYPHDLNTRPARAEKYANAFKKHLSRQVTDALASYDDGIDDAPSTDADNDLALYLFRDEADYGPEGPEINYTYEGNDWFKVDINGMTTVRVRVGESRKDKRHFIIIGLVNKIYDIDIR